MTENPSDKIMLFQIKIFSVKRNNIIIIRRYIMIKYNNLHIRICICQIIFKPAPAVIFIIGRFSVRPGLKRCNNIMNIANLKGIPYRSVKAFEKLLTVFSVNIIVISDNVANRHTHILGIHILNMLFKPRLIADIACMNQKCRLVVFRNILKIIYPFANAVFTDFSIRNLKKAVRRACCNI